MKKTSVPPLWKLHVSEGFFYYIFGYTKASAIKNMRDFEFELYNGQPINIQPITPERAKGILLQVDSEDENSFTTLWDEAEYIYRHNLDDLFVASSFDVIADYTL
jgi:hypothetical protein